MIPTSVTVDQSIEISSWTNADWWKLCLSRATLSCSIWWYLPTDWSTFVNVCYSPTLMTMASALRDAWVPVLSQIIRNNYKKIFNQIFSPKRKEFINSLYDLLRLQDVGSFKLLRELFRIARIHYVHYPSLRCQKFINKSQIETHLRYSFVILKSYWLPQKSHHQA